MNVRRGNAAMRRMTRWVNRRTGKRAEVESTGEESKGENQPPKPHTGPDASTLHPTPTDTVLQPDPDAEPYPEILFDAGFYTAEYPDVERSGLTPWQHFTTRGRWEGRIPSLAHSRLAGAIELRSKVSATPLADILALFPHEAPIAKEFWDRLRPTVHPDFYAAQFDAGVIPSIDEAIGHFFGIGAFDGLRLSLFFNAAWYMRMLKNEDLPPPRGGIHPFTHWLTVGWDHEIVPTPVFDDEFYRSQHPGVRGFGHWTFPHYLQDGCYRTNRPAHPALTKLRPREHQELERQFPLLLHDVLASPDPPAELRTTSNVERRAEKVEDALSLLDSPVMQEMVAKAAEIEPLIMHPYGPRNVNSLPHKHTRLNLMHQAETARTALTATHYDTIVLVPDCGTAGSTRVAGALTKGLHEIAPNEHTLVLQTDRADRGHPHSFHESVDTFDLSSLAQGLHGDDLVLLLLDVLRGLTPNRIINVDSRLGWDTLTTYGKQLSTSSELGAYVFTWRRDAHGNKYGYAVRQLQECFDVLDWVAVDTHRLRDELVDRYALSTPLQEKLRVMHTPAEPASTDYSEVFAGRRAQQWPLRAIWAGGSDPQARFDILIEVAQQLPDLEILAWGIEDPHELGLSDGELPASIRLQGEFDHIDDLPLDAADILLVTSEWGGLPTTLIDAGARGLAVVAGALGGVGDILDEATGFVVEPPVTANAYTQTIRAMIDDPSEVARRAKALRERVASVCSDRNLVGTLRQGLQGATARLAR